MNSPTSNVSTEMLERLRRLSNNQLFGVVTVHCDELRSLIAAIDFATKELAEPPISNSAAEWVRVSVLAVLRGQVSPTGHVCGTPASSCDVSCMERAADEPKAPIFSKAEHCACAIKDAQRPPDWATVCDRYVEDSTWPAHCKHCEHEAVCHRQECGCPKGTCVKESNSSVQCRKQPIAAPPPTADPIAGYDVFRHYVETNIPPGTVISNPNWWAQRLWRTAIRASNEARAALTKSDPQCPHGMPQNLCNVCAHEKKEAPYPVLFHDGRADETSAAQCRTFIHGGGLLCVTCGRTKSEHR